MPSKQLIFKNAAVHYKIMGEGNVVVLLHGFGEDSSIWNEFANVLSEKYRLVIPDIPGSGASEMIAGNSIGLEVFADCIYDILCEENISKCTIIGHSMGGYITLAFAEKYPQMLHAFGLYHSSAFADDEVKKETRKKAIEFIKENGVSAFLKTSTPGLFMDAEESKKDIDDLITTGASFTPDTLIQYYQAMINRPDRTNVLKTFALPVLFILGLHDKAVPFEHGIAQSHLPALSHIFIQKKSAHMSMLEEPENSLLNLERFLQAIYVY